MAKKKKKGGTATKAAKAVTAEASTSRETTAAENSTTDTEGETAPAGTDSTETAEQPAPAGAAVPKEDLAGRVYVVAPRRSITSRRGLLVEGTVVKPGDFPGGEKDFVALVQKKILVRKKG